MIKRDNVDFTFYAGNPLSMRVSTLKEMRDVANHVPFFMFLIKERERVVCFRYVNTKNLASMRVSAIDKKIYFVYFNQKS